MIMMPAIFPRKVWASSIFVVMMGLAGCAAPPAFSMMNTRKPVPTAVSPQPAQQVTLPYRAPKNPGQLNHSMRRAQLAQAHGIWRYAMRKDRRAAVACLSGPVGVVGAQTSQRAMVPSGGGSKWVYRDGRYVRDKPSPSRQPLPATGNGNLDDNACVRFASMLSDQALRMQSVSAPRDVLRYFRAAKSWAMDCAATGPAGAHCSGGSTLSRLSEMKASAVDALDH
ncbi:MAG: hypothetical protein M0Z50_01330 [Planctomycetia bacterium]|nr:hypothetical protein [Planctomycetia bacterium]